MIVSGNPSVSCAIFNNLRILKPYFISQTIAVFSDNPHNEQDGYGCIDITYFYKFHGYYNCYAINPSLVDPKKSYSDIT